MAVRPGVYTQRIHLLHVSEPSSWLAKLHEAGGVSSRLRGGCCFDCSGAMLGNQNSGRKTAKQEQNVASEDDATLKKVIVRAIGECE